MLCYQCSTSKESKGELSQNFVNKLLPQTAAFGLFSLHTPPWMKETQTRTLQSLAGLLNIQGGGLQSIANTPW